MLLSLYLAIVNGLLGDGGGVGPVSGAATVMRSCGAESVAGDEAVDMEALDDSCLFWLSRWLLRTELMCDESLAIPSTDACG